MNAVFHGWSTSNDGWFHGRVIVDHSWPETSPVLTWPGVGGTPSPARPASMVVVR